MYKSPCCDRYIFVAPYIVVAFVIHSICSSLIILLPFNDLYAIQYITYIPIQLKNYKFSHNTILQKYYKVGPNEDTHVLKLGSVRFFYLASTFNAWHCHALDRHRSFFHTDHFQVVLNSVYIGDLENTVKLGI